LEKFGDGVFGVFLNSSENGKRVDCVNLKDYEYSPTQYNDKFWNFQRCTEHVSNLFNFFYLILFYKDNAKW
jgi:hypothetical protein